MMRTWLVLLLALQLSACAWLSPERGASPSGTPTNEADNNRPAGADNAPPGASTRLLAAYELRIDAPTPELRELLGQHLDLARFREAPEDQRLSPAELRRLAATAPEQARGLLETAGYFNAQIRAEDGGEGNDGIRQIRVVVDPGPRAKVSTLKLQLEGALQRQADRGDELAQALRRTLEGSWLLQPQSSFSQSEWSTAKNGLLTRARAQGYPLARLSYSQARVEAELNEVALEIRLESGPLFTMGELKVDGLKHQPEQSVRRLAGYQENQPYNEKALLDFQERLINTQLFDSVSVEIQPDTVTPAPEQDSVKVPVVATVREAARQQVTASLGYHSIDGPSVGIEHMHRRPFDLNLRARTKINLGSNKSSIDSEISSHPQPGMQRSLAALYLERLTANDQVNINLRTRLGYARETDPEDRLYYVELLRAWEKAPQVPDTVAGAVSLNQQVIWRRLDSKMLPSKGYSASLLVGGGWATSTTERNGGFGRAQAKAYWYQPLPSQWLLSVRGEAGQIFARRDLGLPEALRFRTGGDDSVRGYGFEELGPLDAKGNRTGGRVLLNGSVEVAHPLTPKIPALLGAAFIDAGQAARTWGDYKPAWAYGLGVRFRSPVGVLRMDIAKGNEAQRWRLHFSVAIAL